MQRNVNLRITEMLKKRPDRPNQKELAERLGISEGTLHRYLDGTWPVLDRGVLERLLDFLACDLSSLLATTENKFFQPFQNIPDEPDCWYIRRRDAKSISEGRPVAHRDFLAMGHLRVWFQDVGLDVRTLEVSDEPSEKFDEFLSKNCIVIGSPIVNPAAEMAICRIFGGTPFVLGGGKAVPFKFRITPDTTLVKSSIVERSRDGKAGVFLSEIGQFLRSHTVPRPDFKKTSIPKGKDYALIVVSNRKTANPATRKLIVLAGVSGVGTEAAAIALRYDYRNLEPLAGDNDTVWGIIEVFFKKLTDDPRRTFLRYSWRYRVGGRSPIDFTKEKNPINKPPVRPIAQEKAASR